MNFFSTQREMMNPNSRDRDLTEEIHYPSRCQFLSCLDDIIHNPNGDEFYCFKHYTYDPDL